jgi:hypothetical protein
MAITWLAVVATPESPEVVARGHLSSPDEQLPAPSSDRSLHVAANIFAKPTVFRATHDLPGAVPAS